MVRLNCSSNSNRRTLRLKISLREVASWTKLTVWQWTRSLTVLGPSIQLLYLQFRCKTSRTLCSEGKIWERELIKWPSSKLKPISRLWSITPEMFSTLETSRNCKKKKMIPHLPLVPKSPRKDCLLPWQMVSIDFWLTNVSRGRKKARFKSWLDSWEGRTLESSRMRRVRLRRLSRNRPLSWSRRSSHSSSSKSTNYSKVRKVNKNDLPIFRTLYGKFKLTRSSLPTRQATTTRRKSKRKRRSDIIGNYYKS